MADRPLSPDDVTTVEHEPTIEELLMLVERLKTRLAEQAGAEAAIRRREKLEIMIGIMGGWAANGYILTHIDAVNASQIADTVIEVLDQC